MFQAIYSRGAIQILYMSRNLYAHYEPLAGLGTNLQDGKHLAHIQLELNILMFSIFPSPLQN